MVSFFGIFHTFSHFFSRNQQFFFVLQLLQLVYPDLYRVDTLSDEGAIKEEDENGAEILIPQPNRLQLSFEKVSATGKKFREISYRP